METQLLCLLQVSLHVSGLLVNCCLLVSNKIKKVAIQYIRDCIINSGSYNKYSISCLTQKWVTLHLLIRAFFLLSTLFVQSGHDSHTINNQSRTTSTTVVYKHDYFSKTRVPSAVRDICTRRTEFQVALRVTVLKLLKDTETETAS